MSIYICTDCNTVCGSKANEWMPEEVKNAGIGERIVWLATQTVEDLDLTCLNPRCNNFMK